MTKATALLVSGSACILLLAGCVNPSFTPMSKGDAAVDTAKLTLITPDMIESKASVIQSQGATSQVIDPFAAAQPQNLNFQSVPSGLPAPSGIPGMISAPMNVPVSAPMMGGYLNPMGQPMGINPMGMGPIGQPMAMNPMGMGPMGMGPMGQPMAMNPMGMGPMGQPMGMNPMGMGPMGQPMVPDFGPATYGLSSYSNFARPRVYSGVQISDISHEADLVSPDSMLAAPLTQTNLDPQTISAESPAYEFRTTVPRRFEPSSNATSRPTGLAHSTGRDMARATTNVFMRSGPNKSSKSLGVLKQGSSASVEYCDAGWCKVAYGGKDGFVSAKFLRFYTN